MKKIYLATFETVKEKLQKQIEEYNRKESMLLEAVEKIQPVLNHQGITKRTTDALESDSFYSYIQADFSFRVSFTLVNRYWKTGKESTDYLDSYQEIFYFSPNEERTPAFLLEQIQKRTEQIRESRAKLESELLNLVKIYDEAIELSSKINSFQEKYTYTLLGALEI